MPKGAPTLRVTRAAAPIVSYPDQAPKNRQARRALATNSAAWRAIREQQLRREPLCRAHAKRGLVRAGTEVDHEDGNASNNAASNLQTLCKACHSAKTARENGGFGNTRTTRRG